MSTFLFTSLWADDLGLPTRSIPIALELALEQQVTVAEVRLPLRLCQHLGWVGKHLLGSHRNVSRRDRPAGYAVTRRHSPPAMGWPVLVSAIIRQRDTAGDPYSLRRARA